MIRLCQDSYAHEVPDGRECFFVFSRSANENADRVLKSWISDLLQVRWWEAAVGHSFSWRPFVPRHGPVSRQTSGSSKSRFAGRPDDPLTPRYVSSLDLTNVALVSCGVSQAQTWEQNGMAIETHVKMLLFEMFPSLYNTQHTTPHDRKRGRESPTAIPQSTWSTLSAPCPPGTTSSAFPSASSRCLDLLMTFREGRALPTLPSNPRGKRAQHAVLMGRSHLCRTWNVGARDRNAFSQGSEAEAARSSPSVRHP